MAKIEKKFQWSDVIEDELCYCGHKRSEHKNLFITSVKSDQPEVYKLGAGKAGCKKCECERFTWKKFIFKKGGKALLEKGKLRLKSKKG